MNSNPSAAGSRPSHPAELGSRTKSVLRAVNVIICRIAFAVACGVMCAWGSAASGADIPPAKRDAAGSGAKLGPAVHVRPLVLRGAAENRPAATRRLMQGFHDSIVDWSAILAREFQFVPGHPEQGYYGLPGNTENDVRPITYAIQVNAFLGALEAPGGPLDEKRRERCRRDAIAALRYLTHSHVTGGGKCLNGEPWGNAWQSAMWSRSLGLGAWMMWGRLDESLQASVARVIEFEADRFLTRPPRNEEFRNTGAEENAWDAMICSLAANMMPGHPRASTWAERAKLYLYNSLSRRADHDDATPGDDNRPVRDWVTTVNAHPDLTVENHGLVHVGYLKLTVGEMLENAVHYLMAGVAVPRACLHNVDGAYRILLRCMSWDGAPISFGGNDWKITHTQCTDIVIHSLLSQLNGDSIAAHLEEVSLQTVRAIQKEEGGFYNVRRDLEYGGFCATRLMACYFAHAFVARPTPAASPDEFDRRATGVMLLPHGDAILHRTPSKFASFTWGPNRMALAMPREGTWVVWPHFASYLGEINGKNPARANAKLEKIHHSVESDRFSVCGRMIRAGGVRHEFAFASFSGDVTVYIERLRVIEGGRIEQRETGIVGHTYPLRENERLLRGRHGDTRVIGLGGGSAVTLMATDWLNIGDRVGYVVRRSPGRTNLMRYHGEDKGSGRVPLLQEYVSLIGDDSRAPIDEDWACVITFLNQSATETSKWAAERLFAPDDDRATCRIGTQMVRVDFGTMSVVLSEAAQTNR